MHFYGLQKTTLLDYPGILAATLFTGGCDLCCPFCHNKDIVMLNNPSVAKLSDDYINNFLLNRQNILQGICVTGGEPTLQPDLIDFIKKLKSYGYRVKLDTNGFHPQVLEKLLNDYLLDYVAIDIKNSIKKYDMTAGASCNQDALDASIDLLKNSEIDYEFRTTVVKEFHELEDLLSICQRINFSKKYFLQSFEDSGNIIKSGLHPHDDNTLSYYLEKCREIIPGTSLRGKM